MLQRLRHAVGWGPPPGTRLEFQVCAPLGHGQTVYVVGDIPALGGSVDTRPIFSASDTGLALVTTPDLYPIWYNTEPILVPAGTRLCYRFAIFSGNTFLRYEIVPPRELVVPKADCAINHTLDVADASSDLTEESFPGGMFGNVIRLSSGQALVDRRATGDQDSFGSFPKRSSSAKYSATPLQDTIPEESTDVQMTEEEEAPPTPPALPQLSRVNSPNVQSPVTQRKRSLSEDSGKSQDVVIESTDGVIVVVYRLPVLVRCNEDGEYEIEWEDDNLLCPSGLLKEPKSYSNWDRAGSMRITWVGTVHCSSPIPKEDEDRLTRQLAEFHCVPVFLSPSLAETFHSYCYSTLWPIFHNLVDIYGKLPTRWWNPTEQKASWSDYKSVNRVFVNKIIEVYNDGDLVWVHGLHLLVAPSFLLRRLPSVNVGLFLHTPFPSSEIFRTLSVRADLLRGMLSADHIGFHLYEHARHFLTSCRRILGLECSAQSGGYIGIEYSGRTVMVTISHIGIEPPFMDSVDAREQVQEDTLALRDKFWANERTVIVSVDRIERLKGVQLKLSAIEHFLDTHPEWREKLQVIQYGIIDPSDISQEKESKREQVKVHIQRINDKFARDGEPVITYEERENTDLASRLPLWKLGDIYLSTSVRDAVNLYPFEFIYAHELEKKPGVVIVSEFSGSSRVLRGSIVVNPWKQRELLSALEAGLTMSEEEKRARHKKDLEYITNSSRTKWAERILVDLKRTKKNATEGEHLGYGLGLGFRMLEFNAGFTNLDVEAVARAYRTSFRRVLLFDYGNTLTQDQRHDNDFSKYLTRSQQAVKEGSVVSKEEVPPASPELLSALSRLCSDPRNTVFILSGKERDDLEKTLGDVRGLGLAAEHGYLYKWGSSKGGEDDVWLCTKDDFDDSWKDITHSVMDIYTQRTHGTYVELKGSAMLWQYRDADPEFGQLQAKELHDQLTQVLENFSVEVLSGNDYLEVRPAGVDKGVIVDRIMSTIESNNGSFADFVLCVGDDKSDELMFQYLEGMRSRPKLFTATVGKKPSQAKYFMNDVEEVLELLNSITRLSTASSRNLSLNDLHSLDRDLPAPVSDSGFARSRDRDLLGSSGTSSFDALVTPTHSSMSSATLPSRKHPLQQRHSMSMNVLPSAGANQTSSTYEQYLSNVGESDDDGIVGIEF